MMPRPFYKWRSFWIGILVLGFLGWAWVRSMSHEDIVSCFHRDLGASLTNLYAMVGIDRQFDEFTFDQFSFQSFPSETTDVYPAFPAAFFVENSCVYFAHWFLMLAFLVPWSGFLAWRWRRQHKLTKADDAAAAL